MAQTRLHKCAVWSGPLLSAYVSKLAFPWHGLFYPAEREREKKSINFMVLDEKVFG